MWAEGNESYTDQVLLRPFERLLGQPVFKPEIEEAMLTLSGLPGLSIYGVFQPGLRVGETDIVLSVQGENIFDVVLRLDNHGIQETGRNRARATMVYNNISRAADRFTFTAQQSYNPKENLYWSWQYQRHLGQGFNMGVDYLQSDFDIDPKQVDGLEISARTRVGGVHLDKSLLRSRQANLAGSLALRRKRSQSVINGQMTSQADLTTAELSVNFDSVDSFHPFRALYQKLFKNEEGYGGGVNIADFRYTRGFNHFLGAMDSGRDTEGRDVGPGRTLPDGSFAPGQFDKLFGELSRLQLLTPQQTMVLRGEFQWTNDPLVSMEQFSIGGADGVRAFPDSQALYDRAYYLGADYTIGAPFIAERPAFDGVTTWGELVQISFFYDFVRGRRNFPLEINSGPLQVEEKGSWVTYRGHGMGLHINLPGSIEANIIWSRTLGDNLHTPTKNEHRSQLWGDFTYSF